MSIENRIMDEMIRLMTGLTHPTGLIHHHIILLLFYILSSIIYVIRMTHITLYHV